MSWRRGNNRQGRTVARDENSPDPFVVAAAEAIDAGALLPPGASVVVGVSGGADSVALLAALCELGRQPGRGYRVTAAHLNHQLRREADAEQHFTESLAARLGVECRLEQRDVAAEADLGGQSLEQTGRRLRYEFLRRVAEQVGAGYVAVAHHADDQVETVLFRLLRGTHLRGLGGMPAVRDLDADVKLIRPLLGVRRAEIEEFCRRRGLAWCADSSNQDRKFSRNFIRHELLPRLREGVNPRVDSALVRLANSARQIEQHLDRLGSEVLAEALRQPADGRDGRVELDLQALSRQTELIRGYAIRAALERAGLPMGGITADHIAALARMAVGGDATAMDLPAGWAATTDGRALMICPGPGSEEADEPRASWPPVELACPGRTALPDGREVVCELRPMDKRAFEAHCRSGRHDVEWADADAVRRPLLCRPRQPGDVLRPLGLGGTQKAGKCLTNVKYPPDRRDEVLCVADREGVVFLWPVRIDDRVKITPATTTALVIGIAAGSDRP